MCGHVYMRSNKGAIFTVTQTNAKIQNHEEQHIEVTSTKTTKTLPSGLSNMAMDPLV